LGKIRFPPSELRALVVVVLDVCACLKEHCKLSHGAVDYYMNEQQFIRKLNKIESFPVFREQMAKGGKQYVDNNYNWNLILSRLKRVIELVAKSKQRK
jgi:glycosyltransferase involved in cell wall biosynthesis